MADYHTQNENFMGAPEEMKGRWCYTEPISYGNVLTYQKGMDWLADCASVEDWGCGGGGAKPFCKVPYVGVDGSAGPCTNRIEDLRFYRSATPGLFMRHVLEHNPDWQQVLENALASFTQRMTLIMFIQWCDRTELLRTCSSGIVIMGFKEKDIIVHIGSLLKETLVVEEETLLFLEK